MILLCFITIGANNIDQRYDHLAGANDRGKSLTRATKKVAGHSKWGKQHSPRCSSKKVREKEKQQSKQLTTRVCVGVARKERSRLVHFITQRATAGRPAARDRRRSARTARPAATRRPPARPRAPAARATRTRRRQARARASAARRARTRRRRARWVEMTCFHKDCHP